MYKRVKPRIRTFVTEITCEKSSKKGRLACLIRIDGKVFGCELHPKKGAGAGFWVGEYCNEAE